MHPSRLACVATLILTTVVIGPITAAPKAVVFFDLGDSLVSTRVDEASGDLRDIRWMRVKRPGETDLDAHEYLARLRRAGYGVGLIVNLPQRWGDPDLARAGAWEREADPARKAALAAALTRVKAQVIDDYFAGRGPGDPPGQAARWTDPAYPGLSWESFRGGSGESLVLIPFLDVHRKPDRGPVQDPRQLFLFRRALELSQARGAPVVYLGENPHELSAARSAGLRTRQLPYRPGPGSQEIGFFPEEAEIDRLVEESRPGE